MNAKKGLGEMYNLFKMCFQDQKKSQTSAEVVDFPILAAKARREKLIFVKPSKVSFETIVHTVTVS